jgi:flagellar hook-basal body complex protein FliE
MMSSAIASIAAASAGPAGLATQAGSTLASASASTSPGGAAETTPFADLLSDAAGGIDQLEGQAQSAVTGLMTGKGIDVHTAMIATQKASMAFELALAVRNKAVQAYQSVIGMQF